MCPESIINTTYPEWYTIERESEKIIRKLSSVRDLSFYLQNPDEYIRRLAILRLNELKLRESVDTLIEIMENHIESQMNRELAAWTIKSVSLKHNIDLYISSKLLNKFKGSEKYNDLYAISVNDTSPEIRMSILHTPIETELGSGAENIRHFEDINFEAAFPLKVWLDAAARQTLASLGGFLLKIPLILWRIIKKTAVYIILITAKTALILKHFIINSFFRIFKAANNKVKEIVEKNVKKIAEIKVKKIAGNNTKEIAKKTVKQITAKRERPAAMIASGPDRYREYKKEKPVRNMPKIRQTVLRDIVINILYYIFSPVRLIIKKRAFSAVVLIFMYIFLTFTTTGNVFTYCYFGVDLRDVQANAFYSGKEFLTYVWNEIEDLTGINISGSSFTDKLDFLSGGTASVQNSDSRNTAGLEKLYRVTARKGLNLRSEPSGTASKVSNTVLPYNSIVFYLLNSQKDKGGKLWYEVCSEDGRKGWVYSEFLAEAGNALN